VGDQDQTADVDADYREVEKAGRLFREINRKRERIVGLFTIERRVFVYETEKM
jgi:hypothetical protein